MGNRKDRRSTMQTKGHQKDSTNDKQSIPKTNLKNGNILYDCLLLLHNMLAISIEKQRKRTRFLILYLADGWAGGGRPGAR